MLCTLKQSVIIYIVEEEISSQTNVLRVSVVNNVVNKNQRVVWSDLLKTDIIL